MANNEQEQPQTVATANPSGNQEETSPTKPKNADKKEEKKPATNSSTTDMKLIVRSQYWGRILKGKLRSNPHYPHQPYRVITCQAVINNEEGQYWGCCPHHGKRVLELKEQHLADHHPHDWDLYMVGSSVAPSYVVHSFFLLPQNQKIIDISQKLQYNGWTWVGTISSSMARMDLGGYFHDLLKQNDQHGFRYHHVHLEILMNQVFDRETPRTRKAANDKNRAERGDSVSSSSGTANCIRLRKSHNGPPIPHVVSNDASWCTETTQASSVVSADSFPPTIGEQKVHFYPAVMHNMQAQDMYYHPTHVSQSPYVPMSTAPCPAQQLLQQGFSMPPQMQPMPEGYMHPYTPVYSPHAYMQPPQYMMMTLPDIAASPNVSFVEPGLSDDSSHQHHDHATESSSKDLPPDE